MSRGVAVLLGLAVDLRARGGSAGEVGDLVGRREERAERGEPVRSSCPWCTGRGVPSGSRARSSRCASAKPTTCDIASLDLDVLRARARSPTQSSTSQSILSRPRHARSSFGPPSALDAFRNRIGSAGIATPLSRRDRQNGEELSAGCRRLPVVWPMANRCRQHARALFAMTKIYRLIFHLL